MRVSDSMVRRSRETMENSALYKVYFKRSSSGETQKKDVAAADKTEKEKSKSKIPLDEQQIKEVKEKIENLRKMPISARRLANPFVFEQEMRTKNIHDEVTKIRMGMSLTNYL